MRLEKSNIPVNLKSKYNAKFRNFESELDSAKRKLQQYTNDKAKLFGARYTDDPEQGDAQLEQRQQLLELHRGGDAGAVGQQLMERVGTCGQDPEAARPGRLERLHRNFLGRVAELTEQAAQRQHIHRGLGHGGGHLGPSACPSMTANDLISTT